jgi:hypothetical protein
MSPEDKVRPFHSKDPARGQEAADAVAAVLKHAAERDEAAHKKDGRKKEPKWMLPLGLNLAVLALYLLIAPPQWITVNPITAPDSANQSESLRIAMFLQVKRIEAYMLVHGELPPTLDAAGSPMPGVEYIPQGNGRYQLTATAGDQTLGYDSIESSDDFLGASSGRLLEGGS